MSSPLRLDIRNRNGFDALADVSRLLRDAPVPAALAAGLTAEALVAWGEGRAQQASARLERAVVCADRTTSGAGRVFPRLVEAAMLTGIGRLTDADRVLDQCQPLLAEERDERWIPVPAIFRARMQLGAGQLAESVATARAAVDLSERHGAFGFLPLAWLTLAAAALHGDDLPAAATASAAYRAAPPPPRAAVGWATSTWVHARIVAARDGSRAAFDALRLVYDDLDTHQGLLLEEPAAAAWLVRLALREGARSSALMVVARAELLADQNSDLPSLAASAAHARGLVARDSALLERAAAGHAQPWARASAAEDAGVTLRDRRDVVCARESLDRALDGYERAGSVRDAARIRARLRDLGVRRQHGRRRQRPIEGWESLTDTERRVAELVAEGLTNQQTGARLFVSRHTVDFHLRQIFRKLAIASRVELAGIVLALGRPT